MAPQHLAVFWLLVLGPVAVVAHNDTLPPDLYAISYMALNQSTQPTAASSLFKNDLRNLSRLSHRQPMRDALDHPTFPVDLDLICGSMQPGTGARKRKRKWGGKRLKKSRKKVTTTERMHLNDVYRGKKKRRRLARKPSYHDSLACRIYRHQLRRLPLSRCAPCRKGHRSAGLREHRRKRRRLLEKVRREQRRVRRRLHRRQRRVRQRLRDDQRRIRRRLRARMNRYEGQIRADGDRRDRLSDTSRSSRQSSKKRGRKAAKKEHKHSGVNLAKGLMVVRWARAGEKKRKLGLTCAAQYVKSAKKKVRYGEKLEKTESIVWNRVRHSLLEQLAEQSKYSNVFVALQSMNRSACFIVRSNGERYGLCTLTNVLNSSGLVERHGGRGRSKKRKSEKREKSYISKAIRYLSGLRKGAYIDDESTFYVNLFEITCDPLMDLGLCTQYVSCFFARAFCAILTYIFRSRCSAATTQTRIAHFVVLG